MASLKFKRNIYKRFIVSATLFLSMSFFTNMAYSADIAYGDTLFGESRFMESISTYEKLLGETGCDYDILWRLSRSHSKQGNLEDKKKDKRRHYTKAYDYAESAVEADDKGFEGYLYLAEGAGKLTKVVDTEDKVRLLSVIKKSCEMAIELNPGHFKPYFILGAWHSGVADASWLEKQLAGIFFGGLPEASFEEAEKYLKKSIEKKADFIESYYELALVYKEIDEDEKALEMLEKALDCPADTKRLGEIRGDAARLYKRLK